MMCLDISVQEARQEIIVDLKAMAMASISVAFFRVGPDRYSSGAENHPALHRRTAERQSA
jgi:hypothetical protein